jgi:hypothetical protein
MKPGRKEIRCIKCGRAQSTHSSNRDLCHACKPKCREKHYFNEQAAKRYRKPKQKAPEEEAPVEEEVTA